MSIANELISDVAAALFARKEEKADIETKGLTNIVLEVHTTLRRLMADARQHRRSQFFNTTATVPSPNARAASGQS
jgi:hypothetical protein